MVWHFDIQRPSAGSVASALSVKVLETRAELATTLPSNLRIRDEVAGESAEGGFDDEHCAPARAMKELADDGPHDLTRENRRDEPRWESDAARPNTGIGLLGSSRAGAGPSLALPSRDHPPVRQPEDGPIEAGHACGLTR